MPLFLLFATMASLVLYPTTAAAVVFGTPPTITKVTSLQLAMANQNNKPKKPILIEGTIVKRCEKKGCWIDLKADNAQVRIKFKDYAFFIPKSMENTKIQAEGILEKKTISIADQKHYLEDGGASPEKIAAVSQPKQTLEFMATGVKKVKGINLRVN